MNISPKDLIQEIRQVVMRTSGIGAVREDPERFAVSVTFADGTAATVSLTKLYDAVVDLEPSARSAEVERWFQAVVASWNPEPIDWMDAKDRLLPQVRHLCRHDEAGRDPLDIPVVRPCLPFLGEYVCLDAEESLLYLTPRHLETWNVEPHELFAIARDNLLTSGSTFELVGGMLINNDDYSAPARLLLPGWLASFRDRLGGRPVAAPIHDRQIAIARDDKLEALLYGVETLYPQSSEPLSPALYTIDENDAVVPLRLPNNHPEFRRVENGLRALAYSVYQRQTAQLRQQADASTFVADVTATEMSGGLLQLAAIWLESRQTLLPKTDIIVLSPGAGTPDPRQMIPVAWDTAIDIVGGCLQPMPELEPPRVRTLRWPTPEQLASLRQNSVKAARRRNRA